MRTITLARFSTAHRALFTLLGASALTLSTACMLFAKPPQDLDYSRTRVSAEGLYRVSFAPAGDSIPKGRLHQWTIQIQTAAGVAVDSAGVAVDGGMPQHGHGLPTKPRVTRALGDGKYVVDGVKFNMGGWWVMKFRLSAAAGRDSVVFNVKL